MESIISIKKGETQDQFDKRQIRTYVQLIKPILKHPEKTLTEKVKRHTQRQQLGGTSHHTTQLIDDDPKRMGMDEQQIKQLKVSEYPFKQNINILKNMIMLLCANFYSISLNVLTPTFFNIYNLPFLCSPNIEKIRVKAGPKTDYFSYILSSCTNRIAVSNSFFSLICSQPRDKQIRGRDFLFTKYFLNNLPLTVFMQNTLSKLIELLQ